MEIKVNDRDKLYLYSSIVGFIAFFLPWVGNGFLGHYSGYDLLSIGDHIGASKAWYLIIIPISFVIITLSKLGVIKSANPSLIKIVEILPIGLIIIGFIKLSNMVGFSVEDIGSLDGDLFSLIKLGFYLTIIASIIVAFAPVGSEIKKTIEKNESAEQTEGGNSEAKMEEFTKPFSIDSKTIKKKIYSLYNTMIDPIFKWLKRNPKIIILTLIIVSLLLSLYYIFIKDYPKRDGRELAEKYCKCYEKFTKDITNTYSDFIKSFNEYNFKSKSDARIKLAELSSPIENYKSSYLDSLNSICNSFRKKYSKNYKDLSMFENSLIDNQNNCSNNGSSEIMNLNSLIERKIATIRDPLPNLSNILSDLIGKQIFNWRFDALSEFKESTILETEEQSNIVEYRIKLSLAGYTNPSNDLHEAEILVTYLLSEGGWYFNDVKPIYYTQTEIAPVNDWQKVSFFGISDFDYTIIHNGQRFWIRSNYFGKKYKGGPDGDQINLKSNELLIMSRESQPVSLTFKITPKS